VKAGEILMRLDDKDLKARVSQARSSVDQSKARYNQAKVEYDRVMAMAKENAASQHEIDTVQNQIREAEAQLRGSEESLSEAETILSYATIKSPYDATIIDKTVDTGDTVTPGQTLAKLYNPRKMQLVATVRESLATSLHVGQKLPAYISSMKLLCEGTISEIVPQAESQSRSFDVKLVGPCPPGIYSGMFGRIFIPRGSEEVILIPTSAVTTVGQLSLVDLIRDGHLVRQSIQIGRTFDDQAEVLSGLNSGDTLWMKNALPTSTTHPDGKKWILESLDAEGACPVVPNQK
jgi:RND family efflux transporter MFP subunit